MKNFKPRGAGSFAGAPRGGKPPFKSFAKKSYGGNSTTGVRAELHAATCSKCGKPCEVPFMPSGDRPVLCRDCFIPKSEVGERGRPQFNKFANKSDSRGEKRSFDDRFAPRADRPTYSKRTSFAASASTPVNNSGNDEVKKQLSEIKTKLDELARTIEMLKKGE